MIQLKKQQHGKSNLIVSDKLHSVQLSMFSVGTGELGPEIILSLPPLLVLDPLSLNPLLPCGTTYHLQLSIQSEKGLKIKLIVLLQFKSDTVTFDPLSFLAFCFQIFLNSVGF